MILFTTSRKPSQTTRRFARTLSRLIPFSEYITRGKANIETLASIAHKKGYPRVCIVGEYHGNPGRLMFLNTVPEPEWSEIIRFKGYNLVGTKKPSKSIHVRGEKSEEFIQLFGIEELEDQEPDTIVDAGKTVWSFSQYGERILMIKFGGA